MRSHSLSPEEFYFNYEFCCATSVSTYSAAALYVIMWYSSTLYEYPTVLWIQYFCCCFSPGCSSFPASSGSFLFAYLLVFFLGGGLGDYGCSVSTLFRSRAINAFYKSVLCREEYVHCPLACLLRPSSFRRDQSAICSIAPIRPPE